ncbi:M14 family zinc carboxypeptidase [Actinoplanes sp. NPDC049599]|uniref:M14 family zinc carboxypeptidase n=1 Tax=Actinoplanes sp. NPDC049599 TaxID=3363903 RepID=UPI0037B0FE58
MTLGKYHTVYQLDTEISYLAHSFPQLCREIPLPETSAEGRPVSALRIGARSGDGDDDSRRGVLLVGGTHARELMNPECLVDLAWQLVISYLLQSDIVLGNHTWTAGDIKLILDSIDLYLVPCVNPDGHEYVLNTDETWRKNRRPDPDPACVGVDLNRNADFMWGVTDGYTSCRPDDETYAGPAPFSEPETRNVKHLFDTYPICCFADVHSYSELVLHPWGHAPAQTTDDTSVFTTLPTGTCQPIKAGYEEYLSPRDLLRYREVGARIREAIRAVRGEVYTVQPAYDLYPVTGTLSDYAYSRHIAVPDRRKVYGYTLETGPYNPEGVWESFHPRNPSEIIEETESGLIAFAYQCICAIELIGLRVLARDNEVRALRAARDELLATTAVGRAWIALFEHVAHRLMEAVLADEGRRREAAELLEEAGALLREDGATLRPGTVERSIVFLRELEEQAPDEETRAELRATADRMRRLAGLTADEVLRDLMSEPPGTTGRER